MRRATQPRSVSFEGRGNRPSQPGRRHDEDHRDAPDRGSPHPRPPPGGTGGERPVATTTGPERQPGSHEGGPRAQPSKVGRLVSGRTTTKEPRRFWGRRGSFMSGGPVVHLAAESVV